MENSFWFFRFKGFYVVKVKRKRRSRGTEVLLSLCSGERLHFLSLSTRCPTNITRECHQTTGPDSNCDWTVKGDPYLPPLTCWAAASVSHSNNVQLKENDAADVSLLGQNMIMYL